MLSIATAANHAKCVPYNSSKSNRVMADTVGVQICQYYYPKTCAFVKYQDYYVNPSAIVCFSVIFLFDKLA